MTTDLAARADSQRDPTCRHPLADGRNMTTPPDLGSTTGKWSGECWERMPEIMFNDHSPMRFRGKMLPSGTPG